VVDTDQLVRLTKNSKKVKKNPTLSPPTPYTGIDRHRQGSSSARLRCFTVLPLVVLQHLLSPLIKLWPERVKADLDPRVQRCRAVPRWRSEPALGGALVAGPGRAGAGGAWATLELGRR
jgi:hypothetical protein